MPICSSYRNEHYHTGLVILGGKKRTSIEFVMDQSHQPKGKHGNKAGKDGSCPHHCFPPHVLMNQRA